MVQGKWRNENGRERKLFVQASNALGLFSKKCGYQNVPPIGCCDTDPTRAPEYLDMTMTEPIRTTKKTAVISHLDTASFEEGLLI
jgi:hypothetical protein